MILSNGVAVDLPTAESLADRTPIFADNNYYPSGSGLELIGLWSHYSELYRRQVWVSTVIRKLAFAQARLPFVITRQTPGGRDAVPDHPYAKLMARPNERMDPFQLWLWTSSTYDVYGEAYWVKMRGVDRRVREIFPLHPTNLTIRKNDNGEFEYVVTNGSRTVPNGPVIPEADVVPFRNYNPENVMRGLSNLEPLRQTLLAEDASRRATASWWGKGARPAVILQHPKRLSDPALERLRQQFDDKHAGADRVGGTAVLEEGMTATVVQLSAEEMQYIESRKLNREEVCGCYDVPPPVVHILDKATFSNISEQMRSMYRDTMGNRLPLFESALDHHLRPEFDTSGEISGAFDLDGVLRGDFEARAQAVAPLITTGVFKPKEARPLFGLPDAGPEADRLYANAALVPLGSSTHNAPATGTNGEPLPQPLRAAAVRRRLPRELMGKLGRKASADDQRNVLIDQHRAALRALFDQQHSTITQTGDFVPEDWDDELANELLPLAEATARTAGVRLAQNVGGSFDPERLTKYLGNNAAWSASRINATTGALVVAALASDDIRAALAAVFGDQADARADEIAATRVNSIGNFAETEAAKQNGGGTKTWRVNSGNPRPEHEALDGETVGLDEDFSNGLHFPGDPTGDANDNANCTCSLDFEFGDQGSGGYA